MSHQIPNLKPLFQIDRFNFRVFDFINQIDQLYRGLGIPTLYGVLSILANKSVFFIGERGTGKTRTIRLVPEIEGIYTSKWDTFTYQELSNYCESLIVSSEGVEDKHLVFKIEEFALSVIIIESCFSQ